VRTYLDTVAHFLGWRFCKQPLELGGVVPASVRDQLTLG
jgi:hypothetical protein